MPPVLVKHLMTAPVVSLFGEQTLPLAEDIMGFKHIRHLPVVDEDGRCLLGLIGRRDLLRAQISTLSGLTTAERHARQADVRIHQLMTRDVWTVQPETLASIAGQMMRDHRFGCLPVVDATHRLVGIITEREFLDFAVKAIAMHD